MVQFSLHKGHIGSSKVLMSSKSLDLQKFLILVLLMLASFVKDKTLVQQKYLRFGMTQRHGNSRLGHCRLGH